MLDMKTFYEGAKAYFNYKAKSDNPYQKGTKKHQRWHEGYIAAKQNAIAEDEV